MKVLKRNPVTNNIIVRLGLGSYTEISEIDNFDIKGLKDTKDITTYYLIKNVRYNTSDYQAYKLTNSYEEFHLTVRELIKLAREQGKLGKDRHGT